MRTLWSSDRYPGLYGALVPVTGRADGLENSALKKCEKMTSCAAAQCRKPLAHTKRAMLDGAQPEHRHPLEQRKAHKPLNYTHPRDYSPGYYHANGLARGITQFTNGQASGLS